MNAPDDERLSCPTCGADLTGSGRAFCDAACRDRWRATRRERYARPPGALPADLLQALSAELDAG